MPTAVRVEAAPMRYVPVAYTQKFAKIDDAANQLEQVYAAPRSCRPAQALAMVK